MRRPSSSSTTVGGWPSGATTALPFFTPAFAIMQPPVVTVPSNDDIHIHVRSAGITEQSFDYIWRVDQVRRLGQRLTEYLSVLLVGPFAVFLALGMTAGVMNSGVVAQLQTIEPFGARW